MTLAAIKDWLKTKTDTGDGIAVGVCDRSCDRFISVYGRSGVAARMPIGRNGSYDEKSIAVLVHWTKQATEAEQKAREIYNIIRSANRAQTADGEILFSRMAGGEPVANGQDVRGIFEYTIEAILYCGKEG